jgi:hypothetical protein
LLLVAYALESGLIALATTKRILIWLKLENLQNAAEILKSSGWSTHKTGLV